MYFAAKITFVNLQVSNLKLQHTRGHSLACHMYAKLIFAEAGYVFPGTPFKVGSTLHRIIIWLQF